MVTLLDGAIGTCLWEMTGENDAVWKHNIKNTEIVETLHRNYIQAGSEIICTNTFGANRLSMKNSDYDVTAVVKAGVAIAKKAAAGTNAKVALDIGPLTDLLEPYGDVSIEEANDIYNEVISAGISEDPDIIFFETFMDIDMLELCALIADTYNKPIFCSMSFEAIGKTMMGNSVSDMITRLEKIKNINAIGMNCSLEPTISLKIIEEFYKTTDKPLIFKPNAGLPQYESGKAISATNEQFFSQEVLKAKNFGTIYIGGCCGTDPSYIRCLKENL